MKKKTETHQITPTPENPINLVTSDLNKIRLPTFADLSLRIPVTNKVLAFSNACKFDKVGNAHFLFGIIQQPGRTIPREYYPPSDEEELELGIIAIVDTLEKESSKYVYVDLKLIKKDGKLFVEYQNPSDFTRLAYEIDAAHLRTTEESEYWYNISKARQNIERVDYQLFKAAHDALHYAYWSDLEYVVPKKEWPGPALMACGLVGSFAFKIQWMNMLAIVGFAVWVYRYLTIYIMENKRMKYTAFIRDFR